MSATTMQRIEAQELFQGCRHSQVKEIDRLGTTVDLAAGRTLCTEGKPGSQFFVLLDGLVQVQNSSGRLALLHSGAWFGETALIHDTSQRASVTTVVESTLIVFDRSEFNALRHIDPHVRERLDDTATLYLRGETPASHPWYQPIDAHAPLDGASHTAASQPVAS